MRSHFAAVSHMGILFAHAQDEWNNLRLVLNALRRVFKQVIYVASNLVPKASVTLVQRNGKTKYSGKIPISFPEAATLLVSAGIATSGQMGF